VLCKEITAAFYPNYQARESEFIAIYPVSPNAVLWTCSLFLPANIPEDLKLLFPSPIMINKNLPDIVKSGYNGQYELLKRHSQGGKY